MIALILLTIGLIGERYDGALHTIAQIDVVLAVILLVMILVAMLFKIADRDHHGV